MDVVFHPANQPFLVAGLIVLGLILVEAVGLAIGISGLALDHDAGLHHPLADGEHAGSLTGALDWLNVGRVPLLVLIILALAAFSIVGFAVQSVALSLGLLLPAWLTGIGAAAAALPATRAGSRLVSRLVPRDETYATEDADFIGRTAVVTVGPVRRDGVARAKLRDAYGNWHFPRVRPADPAAEFPTGATVLIVDRSGREFLVIEADAALKPADG